MQAGRQGQHEIVYKKTRNDACSPSCPTESAVHAAKYARVAARRDSRLTADDSARLDGLKWQKTRMWVYDTSRTKIDPPPCGPWGRRVFSCKYRNRNIPLFATGFPEPNVSLVD